MDNLSTRGQTVELKVSLTVVAVVCYPLASFPGSFRGRGNEASYPLVVLLPLLLTMILFSFPTFSFYVNLFVKALMVVAVFSLLFWSSLSWLC